MKKLLKILLLATLVLAAGAVWAGDEPELELTVDGVSRYIWRGYDLSHGDPSLLVYLNYSPSAAPGLWMNVGVIGGLRNDAALGDDKTDFDEVDATLGYEAELAGGAWTVGAALYYYRYESTWTRDFAYGDATDLEANLYAYWNASEHFKTLVEYYRGLDDNIKGDYVEFGFSLPFEGDTLSTEPKVLAGWSNQYGVADRLTNVTATLPLTWTSGSFAFTPSLNYTWVDDPEGFNPRDLVGETPKDGLLWLGVRLAWSF